MKSISPTILALSLLCSCEKDAINDYKNESSYKMGDQILNFTPVKNT